DVAVGHHHRRRLDPEGGAGGARRPVEALVAPVARLVGGGQEVAAGLALPQPGGRLDGDGHRPGAHQGPAHLALAGERVGGAVAGALLDLALAVRHVAGVVEVDAEHGSDLRGVYPPGQASARPVGPAGPASRAPAASGAWRRKSASAPSPRRTASHRVAIRMRMVAAAAVAWSTP